MMPAPGVHVILAAPREAAIPAWVDGGWGVDALLGEQTRAHTDLDLVIALEHAPAAMEALALSGFYLAEDELPTRFVLATSTDRHVDFHAVAFDTEGAGWQQLQDGRRFRYPPEGFQSVGLIGGEPVPCLSPAVQLSCHLGYEPDETDRADVGALAARFGLELPRPYR
jgi:lincosamide nucleotidyltransferase A/C/D/E